VFRKELTPALRTNALVQLAGDLRGGLFASCSAPWKETFAKAEELSEAHAEKLGNRGFDVLHVAAALALGATTFFTFDLRQKSLAKAAGLKVRP
jgi:hypothetical protein